MKLLKKIVTIFSPIILGTIVGILIKNSIDYEFLFKPPASPPAWLFPVAWTIIYFLMGLSFYLYKEYGPVKNLDKIYYTQLILNLLWSPLFFILKFRFISTVWIIFLTLVVILQVCSYFRYYKTSAYLNIPYLLWLIFASYLAFSIYLLN